MYCQYYWAKWTRQSWLRETRENSRLPWLQYSSNQTPWHDIHKYLLFSLNPCQHSDGQPWSCWFCVGGFYLFIWDLGRCFAALRALFGFTSRWQRNCSSFSLPWEQSKALIQVRKAISTAPLLRRPFAVSVLLQHSKVVCYSGHIFPT